MTGIFERQEQFTEKTRQYFETHGIKTRIDESYSGHFIVPLKYGWLSISCERPHYLGGRFSYGGYYDVQLLKQNGNIDGKSQERKFSNVANCVRYTKRLYGERMR